MRNAQEKCGLNDEETGRLDQLRKKLLRRD
jgi:hypothetical protein